MSLHLVPLLGRVVVDGGDDLLRLQELYRLTQLGETAVLTIWDTCVQHRDIMGIVYCGFKHILLEVNIVRYETLIEAGLPVPRSLVPRSQ